MDKRQQKQLEILISSPVKYQCHLAPFTSFGIGGPADALVKVQNGGELQQLLAFLEKEGIVWRIIGRGTNLLVRDTGFPGVILLLDGEFKRVEKLFDPGGRKNLVRAAAGLSLKQCAIRCMEWGLGGLEFAHGIPGTIGGAVIMNAGAWGGDMSSVVSGVTLVTAGGEIHLKRSDINFSYRCWSGFSNYMGRGVVAQVEFELVKGDPQTIREHCRQLQDERKKSQPASYPNAGSFFKNPSGSSAGRLIDASGLKGTAVGGAMISLQHGNFLVNTGGATAEDVLELMVKVQEKVKSDSGIELEPEVHIL